MVAIVFQVVVCTLLDFSCCYIPHGFYGVASCLTMLSQLVARWLLSYFSRLLEYCLLVAMEFTLVAMVFPVGCYGVLIGRHGVSRIPDGCWVVARISGPYNVLTVQKTVENPSIQVKSNLIS